MPRRRRSGLRRRNLTESSARQVIDRATKFLLRGASSQALKILAPAIVQFPDNAAIFTRFADALYQAGDILGARNAYRSALVLDESVFQAWYGCGMAEYSLGAHAHATDCLNHAAALKPEDAEVRFYLGKALFQMGEIDRAIDEFSRAAKSGGMQRQAVRQIAVIIPGSASRGNREILQARRASAALEEKFERPAGAGKIRRPGRSGKLRIGYVSSFFRDRNWMKPVWGAINHHDRSSFEIHLFADQGDPTSQSGYRKHSSDFVHSITGLSNAAAARRIARAGIDVLVDLNSYSAPDRLGIFMCHPAPAIAAWFNAYATTGIGAFDCIIGDAEVIPPSEERFYAEQVARVPGSYLAFSVLYPVPAVEPPPSVKNGYVTFGCLAPLYKIVPEVIAAWAQILRAAPTARLLLKSSQLHDAAIRAAVLAKFSRLEIASERLLLEEPEEHFDFLKAYSRVDIALDTFPYNGGTTTMEALWQGVPVLTFSGDRWVGRISRSILAAAELAEWVEPLLKAYIDRAVRLAVSPGTCHELASMRGRMRDQLQRSAACDSATLCRELERRYRLMAKNLQG